VIKRSLTVAVVVMLVALAIYATKAFAHSWYDPACCSGRDCAPIPVSALKLTAGGTYVLTLSPGQHPMVTETRSYYISEARVRRSQDGDVHACIDPTGRLLLCLYMPEAGI
jgi:hypothetical protein